MNEHVEHLPFLALIDDDQHSAYLLTRMLLAHGSPNIQHYGDAVDGSTRLQAVLDGPPTHWPGLIIVDLKAHSQANHDFVAALQPTARQKGVPIVVMSQPTGRQGRQALHEAGASAIFFRQAELGAYRSEAASIVSFWARFERLDTVGM